MSWHRPVLISERETGHRYPDGTWDGPAWEDCSPCAVLSAIDGHTGGRMPVPKTHAEAEQLRYAAGYPALGGTNIQRLAATAVIRYRVPLPLHRSGFDAIWTAMRPGTVAAIAGSMAAFGPGHPLSRWQRGFDGTHAVTISRESSAARVAWVDPLAPTNAYTGDWVSRDELRAFLSRGIAAAVIWPLAQDAA